MIEGLLLALSLLVGTIPATDAVPATGGTTTGARFAVRPPVTMKHSGTVVSVDAQRSVLVMEEIGAARAKDGRPIVTRLTITLTPRTRVNAFIRVNVPGAFAGDFIEVALDVADITPADFITVSCVHEPRRLRAAAVTLAETY